MDISYNFYFKHNMHAVEWKLDAPINKDKSLINNLNRNWRNPLLENLIVIMFDYYELTVFFKCKWTQ